MINIMSNFAHNHYITRNHKRVSPHAESLMNFKNIENKLNKRASYYEGAQSLEMFNTEQNNFESRNRTKSQDQDLQFLTKVLKAKFKSKRKAMPTTFNN